MKVIGACDSFKESVSAAEALDAIGAGLRRIDPGIEFVRCPVADGGEGTIDAVLASGRNARRFTIQAHGPLRGQRVDATWALLDDGGGRTALIEIGSAAGFSLVPKAQRNPMRTTSFGVGEIVIHALAHSPRRVVLWLGGSATCDGGTGVAQALGAAFRLKDGSILDRSARPITGADLVNIEQIAPVPSGSLRCADGSAPEFLAACDVTNPLLGTEGSARVFAPQKGAGPDDVEVLERGLANLASLCPVIDQSMPRAGSAGGLGFGLATFLGAQLVSGIDLLLDIVDFDRRAAGADVVMTGEGSLDAQSRRGKAVSGVARRARALGLPVIAIAGRIDRERLPPDLAAQFCAMYAITDVARDADDAMNHARRYLSELGAAALRAFTAQSQQHDA